MNIVSNRRFLLYLGKAIVLLLTLFFLYRQVFSAPDTFLSWGNILQEAYTSPVRYLLLLTALLIPVNWGFEARKWQLLGNKVERMTFKRAYQAVMVGLTLGFITPNRIGDYAGRVLVLQSKQRLDAIGAIFIGRFSQLVATVLVGALGVFYFLVRFYWEQYPAVCISVVLLLLALNGALLLLLYNARAMVALVAAVRPLRKVVRYIAVMNRYNSQEVTRLLMLSLGRYMVFLTQFVLLLYLFKVRIPLLQYLCGISGTFFLKSIAPSVTILSDLGVRELSAMYLFGLLGQERLQVLSASLSLWLLNIAVPSALGLIFVFRLKFFRKEKEKGKPA